MGLLSEGTRTTGRSVGLLQSQVNQWLEFTSESVLPEFEKNISQSPIIPPNNRVVVLSPNPITTNRLVRIQAVVVMRGGGVVGGKVFLPKETHHDYQ